MRPRGKGLGCAVGAWLTAMLAGCTVGPDFTPPAPAVVHGFDHPSPGAPAASHAPDGSGAERALRADWRSLLASPDVETTEREALANNWTLAARKAAIARARQALAAARSGDAPALNASGQLGQTRIGATVFGPDAYDFPIFSSYGAGVDAAYDPDLFGGRRRRIEAAAASERAEVYEKDAVELTLVGDVALQAIAVAEAKRELELLRRVREADERIAVLVRQAHAAGASPRTDIELADASRDQDVARLPAVHQRLQAAGDALAVLVGKSPTDWKAPDFQLDSFALPDALPTTLPSELASRRPDVLAAEEALHVASAEIGVATADLYPQLSLSATLAREGLFAGPAETAWSLLVGVGYPIFNGGRLRAAKRGAEAAYRQRFADYQNAVVTALAQVSGALESLSDDADTLSAEQRTLSSATHTLELDRQGYRAGGADLVNVLRAQRTVDNTEALVVQASAARLADVVRLFVALGIHPPAQMQTSTATSGATGR